jgi:hypothetical protein
MKNLIKFGGFALLIAILSGCNNIQDSEYSVLDTVESNVSVDYELHEEKDKLYISVDINGSVNEIDYDIIEYINDNYDLSKYKRVNVEVVSWEKDYDGNEYETILYNADIK